MSKQASFAKSIGGNLAQSIGLRAGGSQAPSALNPDTVSDQSKGRTRMREAGHMELENIIPDSDQVRTEFNEASIKKLAESIKKFGVMMPLEVRWNSELKKHQIVHGERRYRAAKIAELTSVPCIFSEGDLTESEKKQRMLTENCLREDLTPLEQANAFKQLMDLNSWNSHDLAEALCLSKGLVSQRMAILSLPKDIQSKVEEGALSGAAAYKVSQIEDEEVQREVVEKVESEGLNRQETADLVNEKTGKSPASSKAKPGRPVTSKSHKLSKCSVTLKFNKKRVTIADELAAVNELRDKLMKEPKESSGAKSRAARPKPKAKAA